MRAKESECCFQSPIDALLVAAGLDDMYAVELLPSGRDIVVRVDDGRRFDTAGGMADILSHEDARDALRSSKLDDRYRAELARLLESLGADDLAAEFE